MLLTKATRPFASAYGIQEANSTLTIPDDSTLFAPTLLPSNDARYEVFTAYNNFGSGTVREWGVYDHKNDTFVTAVTKIINSTFLNKYTSGGFYSTIIQKYGSWWRVYLWNYDTTDWELIVTGIGDAGDSRGDGWSIYEEYLDSCSGGIPEIESKNLQIYNDGWKHITSTYGSEFKNLPHCGSSNYTTTWDNQYYAWKLDPT